MAPVPPQQLRTVLSAVAAIDLNRWHAVNELQRDLVGAGAEGEAVGSAVRQINLMQASGTVAKGSFGAREIVKVQGNKVIFASLKVVGK